MIYLVLSMICCAIGVAPLIFRKKWRMATVAWISGSLLWWWFLWGIKASFFGWPLLGGFGMCVLVMLIVSAVIDCIQEDEFTWTLVPLAVLASIYIFTALTSWSAFNAHYYHSMTGAVEQRTWTRDVQPTDPNHIRMATKENALVLAKKVLGEQGAIGSQFQIDEEDMTLQMINGDLWYVAPLEFAGFTQWLNTRRSPGYVKVHGVDPNRRPILVILPEAQRYVYMPSACFGENLTRHLRYTGYLNTLLTDYTFEVDERGYGWWVLTVFEPTRAWSAPKVKGIAVVDPQIGTSTFYTVDKIPSWVDRAYPQEFVKKYLDMRGIFIHGWLNSWWARKELTIPQEPNLVYGADGQPYWVTGMTSSNKKDDSLVEIIYTNSRTGVSVSYKAHGGATDTAILEIVNSNQDVQFKHLKGADPQLYNVYGTMAAVVPLLNENHYFQGVAIVNITNVQNVAVGRDQHEALRNYQKKLALSGQQVSLGKEYRKQSTTGIIDRFTMAMSNNETGYYLHITGVPHIFFGGQELSPKLPLTKEGDTVAIGFVDSGEDVLAMSSFDNRSLALKRTQAQAEISRAADTRVQQEEARTESGDVMERIRTMTPEQINELGRNLPGESGHHSPVTEKASY